MRDQGGDVQCTAWRLLDAQFWGVPQRRKRIYLVNDFGNGRAGQILFECESVLGYGYTQSGYGEFKEGVGTLKKSRGVAGGGSETLAVIMERIAAAVKYRVRRLTPLECERLDGFPDEWTRYGASGKEMSDNARYMALGNSIAVPCAERVFIGIKKAESEENRA